MPCPWYESGRRDLERGALYATSLPAHGMPGNNPLNRARYRAGWAALEAERGAIELPALVYTGWRTGTHYALVSVDQGRPVYNVWGVGPSGYFDLSALLNLRGDMPAPGTR